MKKFAVIASGFVLAMGTLAACRGSVDRVYDDGIVSTIPETGGGTETSTPANDGGNEGDGAKEHSDGSVESGAGDTQPATITVSVAGLEGNGLVLQNNGGDDLPIPATGAFSFTTKVPPGKPYKVTVANQPSGPSQTCSVLSGEGVAVGKDIDVKVNCATATFPVGGAVVGLGAGKQVVLQNNGGNDVTVTGDTTFTFPGVASGKTYNVSVKTNPVGVMCKLSGETGTVVGAAINSVVVNCDANSYTIGGNVTGLSGSLIITNNGGNDRVISANGTYAFATPITNGGAYKVEVKTQPAYPPVTQVCTVANGTGSVAAADVKNADITCVTSKYTVKGTVTGLVANGLKLQNKGTDDKSVPANATSFSFATQIASGIPYNVTILTQPTGQQCSVTNPSGTVQSADIANVVINCAPPIILEEHFDTVAEPNLPAGWTSIALMNPGATLANKWTTLSDPGHFQSSPYSAFIENIGTNRDVALITPVFNVASSTAKLTFWNDMESEPDWDGGVLEIKIGAADWADILDAGGSFNAGTGYNLTLKTGGFCTLEGRRAWNGSIQQTASVNLPASAAGQSVQLRWRFASDDGANDNGWWIDDVVITN